MHCLYGKLHQYKILKYIRKIYVAVLLRGHKIKNSSPAASNCEFCTVTFVFLKKLHWVQPFFWKSKFSKHLFRHIENLWSVFLSFLTYNINLKHLSYLQRKLKSGSTDTTQNLNVKVFLILYCEESNSKLLGGWGWFCEEKFIRYA